MRRAKVFDVTKRIGISICAVALAGSVLFASGCSTSTDADSSSSSSSAAVEASDVREFTDSAGRTVELPAEIERIAPSGFTAQQVLLTIAPEKMVGLASALTDDQLQIFGEDFADYPVFGAVLGASDTLNREAIAEADPQIIIDTGEYKDGIEEDLDELQDQIGIPCVFIETTLDQYGDAYKLLGELLGEEERGTEIGNYLQAAYDEVVDVMAGIDEADRVQMAYIVSSDTASVNAIAKTSYQGQVVDMVADNVVVTEDVSGKGDGNEISLEQLAVWDPALIVFQNADVYDAVGSDSTWQTITAVADGNYYLCPSDPWCWLNNPPTVNQMMGVQWLPRLLYPDAFEDSIEDVTKSYYETLYNYTLTDAELASILEGAVLAG